MLVTVLWAIFVLTPTLARAGDPPCSDEVERWVRSCAETSGQSLSPSSCPSGMAIVRAALDDSAELRIEVRRPAGRSMVEVGDVGISAIGDFPQWAETPPELQAALAAVVECAESNPIPTLASGPPHPKYAPATPDDHDDQTVAAAIPPTPVPWLGLAGLVVFAIVALRVRGPIRAKEGYYLVLALICAALQSTLAWSYFLQNGHGPEWVAFALLGHDGLASFGPGYAELLAGLVRLAPSDPEAALAWVYLGLGIVISLSTYLSARAVGCRPALASALLVIVALDPSLVRLLRSPGYQAPILALHFLAAALLVIATRRTSARTPMFVLATIGAGLLIAQAARVHPVGWLGASVLPLVVLAVPGHTRTRIAQAGVATVLIAAVVALTSLPELMQPLQTHQGQHAVERGAVESLVVGLIVLTVGTALLLRRPTRRARLLTIVALLGGTVVYAVQLNPVGVDAARYQAGYFLCLAPMLGVGAVALISRLLPGRREQAIAAAVLVAIAGLVSFATRAERVSPATDARESTWAIEWRARDWGVSRVVYIREAHGSAVTLPLHVRGGLAGVGLRAEDVPSFYLGEPVLYYRSSLCSAAGREACLELESRLELEEEAVLERELPAIASQSWHPLEGDTVRVGLYRARPRSQAR